MFNMDMFDSRQLRERLEQETGKRTSSEGDTGENLSKVRFTHSSQ